MTIAAITLLAIDNRLYLPSPVGFPWFKELDTDDEPRLLLYRYDAGDCDTIKARRPDEKQLRSCLYDERECGYLPPDCRSVTMPDGSIFLID